MMTTEPCLAVSLASRWYTPTLGTISEAIISVGTYPVGSRESMPYY